MTGGLNERCEDEVAEVACGMNGREGTRGRLASVIYGGHGRGFICVRGTCLGLLSIRPLERT
jgi:hypothetical protein